MKFTLAQLATFASEWKSFKLVDADLQSLETMLMQKPTAGQPMAGTGGLRKIRFAPPSWHTGKSGAARVCYALFPAHQHILLVTLFAKNDKANLTRAERNRIAKYLTWYETTL